MEPDQPIDISIKSFIVKDMIFKNKGLGPMVKIIKNLMIGTSLTRGM